MYPSSEFLAALANIVEAGQNQVLADFKTVEKIFSKEAPPVEVEDFLERYKRLKNANKIKVIEQRNIDFWGKQDWQKFTSFVEELEGTKSKAEELKTKANEGAELRAEDDNWVVYKILTRDACIFYGTNKWCISKDGSHYDNYTAKGNDFYFLFSKKLGKDSPWHKIALQVSRRGKKTYWDAADTSHRRVPADLNIPDFKIDEKEKGTLIEELIAQINDFIAGSEEYRQVDIADHYLLSDAKIILEDLSSEAEELVDELKERVDNWKDELRELADAEFLSSYYVAHNEIARVQLGTEEQELPYEILEELESLSEEDFKKVQRSVDGYLNNDRSTVYIGSDEDSYILTLNTDKLRKRLEELKEYDDEEEIEDDEAELGYDPQTNKLMKALSHLVEAWGGGSRRTYYSRDRKKEDPYQDALDAINEKGDEDADEVEDTTEEPTQYASEDLQEGLKKIVTKGRSKHERLNSLPKISDQAFLFETSTSDKQNDEVRQAATRYIKDQDMLEKIAALDFEPAKKEAIKRLTDKKLIEKYAKEGFISAISKITDEDLRTDLLIKFKDNFGYSSYYNSSLSREALRVKKDENLAKLLKLAIVKKDEGTSQHIAKTTKDEKLLRTIAEKTKGLSQSIALIRLKDKNLAKKIAVNPEIQEDVRQVALKIADDPALYGKAFEADPNFTDIIDFIEDDKTLKDLYSKDPKAGPKILPKIKDQEFLKGVIEKDDPNQKHALKGITDQKYLKELMKDKEENEEGLKNIAISDIVAQMTDQDFLKSYYASSKETFNNAYEKHSERQQGANYRKMFDYWTDDPTSQERAAALENIKDDAFLLKVYKNEKNPSVRQKALYQIKDVKTLGDIFAKEKRKTEKVSLIDTLKDNTKLMVELLITEKDPEVASGIASRIEDPQEAKDLLTKFKAGGSSGVESNYDDFLRIVQDVGDEAFLKKLALDKGASVSLRDMSLNYIKDEKFFVEYYKANKDRLNNKGDFVERLIENTEDKETLLEMALTHEGSTARTAFEKLEKMADSATMAKIALKAKKVDLRKKAVPYITDLPILKKIALFDPEIAIQVLPMFKDDKEFLKKLLLESKDRKVKMNLIKRIKDDAILKEIAKGSDDLALEALSRIQDQKFLKEILLSTGNLEVATKIVENKNIPTAVLLEFITEKFKFVGWGARSLAQRVWDHLAVEKAITQKMLDTIGEVSEDATRPLLEALTKSKDVDLLKHWALSAEGPSAVDAFDAVRSPEFAEEVMTKAKNQNLRKEALLWIAPGKLTADRVEDFIAAMDATDEPHAISEEIKVRAYQLGNEDEQDALVKHISKENYNERHKKESDEEDRHYMKPRTIYREQKGLIKKQDHPVTDNPQQEVLRLLVRLAR